MDALKKSRAEQKAIGLLKNALKRTQKNTGEDFDIAVAVSGGADSLALTAVVSKTLGKNNFITITIDHNLQADSGIVAQNAAEKCLQLGSRQAIVKRVEIQGAQNLEANARAARYEAFEQITRQYQAQQQKKLAILLAHTLDDQAETVLLQLARGSGTNALSGMAEFRDNYLRPFLQLTRNETEQICQANNLDYWIDPTNSCSEGVDLSQNQGKIPLRSCVRSILLPKFTQVFPGIYKNLARTATILRADSELLEQLARDEYANCTIGRGEQTELDIQKLRALPNALRWRIIKLWCQNRPNSAQLSFERVVEIDTRLVCLDGLGGRNIQLPGCFTITRTAENTLSFLGAE
jgi:tRNA(Ile)-lysidine synthase